MCVYVCTRAHIGIHTSAHVYACIVKYLRAADKLNFIQCLNKKKKKGWESPFHLVSGVTKLYLSCAEWVTGWHCLISGLPPSTLYIYIYKIDGWVCACLELACYLTLADMMLRILYSAVFIKRYFQVCRHILDIVGTSIMLLVTYSQPMNLPISVDQSLHLYFSFEFTFN